MPFWKNKKVLITGGAGFIGSHLAKNRLEDEAEVTCVDNLERGKKEYIKSILPHITFLKEDLKNQETTLKISKDMDIIFHLASKVGGIGYYLSKPGEVITENTLIDANIISAIKKHKTSYFFYASSAHVYPKEFQEQIDPP